jgi:hypothetical protein
MRVWIARGVDVPQVLGACTHFSLPLLNGTGGRKVLAFCAVHLIVALRIS